MIRHLIIILFVYPGGMLVLSACTHIDSTGIYRSDEYVIDRLQENDTPAVLAEKFLGNSKKSWVIEDANKNISYQKNNIVVIPLKDGNIGGLTANGYQVVPILCYHRFADNCKSRLCMPAYIFKKQMKYLKKNGYRVINFSQLLDFLEYRKPIPEKSVIVSIDDGYRSVYNIAYPILKKYGFTATLFIYTDFIGVSRNALTWHQLAKMKADGIEIGSHTVHHSDLSKPKQEEDAQAYMARINEELRLSKRIIDKKLGQNTTLLAYPYGRYNKTVLKISEQSGYRIAVTVKRGSNPFFMSPFKLKRTQILRRDMKSFIPVLKSFHELSLK